MDMLRLDRKPENVPSFLLALCFKKLLTAVLEFSYKNRLPSFGTPDEMIDNEMDSVADGDPKVHPDNPLTRYAIGEQRSTQPDNITLRQYMTLDALTVDVSAIRRA